MIAKDDRDCACGGLSCECDGIAGNGNNDGSLETDQLGGTR
jgi:hypothetical protein